jgi:hypothetical protein
MSALLNVGSVLRDPLFSQSFQVERFTGAFANEGVYNRGSAVILAGQGNIQPAKDDDLNVLPEGERDGKYIKCYSLGEIRKGDGKGIESDQIIWDGKKYRVMYTKLYKDYGYWFSVAEEV